METYNIYKTYVLPCHDYFENMKQTGGTPAKKYGVKGYG
jgi:hypothetical protein